MRKLCISTKSSPQKIKWNYGIFRSVLYQNKIWWTRARDSRLQILFVLGGFEREFSEMQELHHKEVQTHRQSQKKFCVRYHNL